MQVFRSLVQMRTSNGSKTEPCGTPVKISLVARKEQSGMYRIIQKFMVRYMNINYQQNILRNFRTIQKERTVIKF